MPLGTLYTGEDQWNELVGVAAQPPPPEQAQEQNPDGSSVPIDPEGQALPPAGAAGGAASYYAQDQAAAPLAPAGTAPPPTQTVQYPTATGSDDLQAGTVYSPENTDPQYGQQVAPSAYYGEPYTESYGQPPAPTSGDVNLLRNASNGAASDINTLPYSPPSIYNRPAGTPVNTGVESGPGNVPGPTPRQTRESNQGYQDRRAAGINGFEPSPSVAEQVSGAMREGIDPGSTRSRNQNWTPTSTMRPAPPVQRADGASQYYGQPYSPYPVTGGTQPMWFDPEPNPAVDAGAAIASDGRPVINRFFDELGGKLQDINQSGGIVGPLAGQNIGDVLGGHLAGEGVLGTVRSGLDYMADAMIQDDEGRPGALPVSLDRLADYFVQDDEGNRGALWEAMVGQDKQGTGKTLGGATDVADYYGDQQAAMRNRIGGTAAPSSTTGIDLPGKITNFPIVESRDADTNAVIDQTTIGDVAGQFGDWFEDNVLDTINENALNRKKKVAESEGKRVNGPGDGGGDRPTGRQSTLGATGKYLTPSGEFEDIPALPGVNKDLRPIVRIKLDGKGNMLWDEGVADEASLENAHAVADNGMVGFRDLTQKEADALVAAGKLKKEDADSLVGRRGLMPAEWSIYLEGGEQAGSASDTKAAAAAEAKKGGNVPASASGGSGGTTPASSGTSGGGGNTYSSGGGGSGNYYGGGGGRSYGGGGGGSYYGGGDTGGYDEGGSMWDNPIFARFLETVGRSNPEFLATIMEMTGGSGGGSSRRSYGSRSGRSSTRSRTRRGKSGSSRFGTSGTKSRGSKSGGKSNVPSNKATMPGQDKKAK